MLIASPYEEPETVYNRKFNMLGVVQEQSHKIFKDVNYFTVTLLLQLVLNFFDECN